MPPNVPDAEEVHFELEELLGLRGPLSALLKNFLWLLAFNTTYLGLFAFIPYTVGMNVSRALSKSLYIRGAAFFIYKKVRIYIVQRVTFYFLCLSTNYRGPCEKDIYRPTFGFFD